MPLNAGSAAAQTILEMAIKRERLAQALYAGAAAQARSSHLQNVLSGLHADECGHERALGEIYAEVVGCLPEPASEAAVREDADCGTTVSAILEFAMAREVEAHDFYEISAETATDEAMKTLLARLACEEQHHYDLLRAELAGRGGNPWLDDELDSWVRDD